MKLFLLAALAANSIYAQAVQDPHSNLPTPTELVIPEVDDQALTITILQDHVLADNYKIPEWQSKRTPILAKQQEIRERLCLRVGVPKDKLNTSECQLIGFAEDGGVVQGPDGKPLPRKVVHVVPPTDKTK